MTVERVRSSVNAMCDSHTESQRLEGIVTTIEDLHAKQCFLQVKKNYSDTFLHFNYIIMCTIIQLKIAK